MTVAGDRISAELAAALAALVRAAEAARATPGDRQAARRAIEQSAVVAGLAKRDGFGSGDGGRRSQGR